MGTLYGTEADLLRETDLGFLDSSQTRRKSRGVTIDADEVTADGDGYKVMKSGTVIGEEGSGGKFAEVVAGVKATKSIGTVEALNLLDLTALLGGVAGNAVSFIMTGLVARASTDVQYDSYLKTVTFHLKNNGASITAIATDIIDAITAGAVSSTVEIGANDAKIKLTAKAAGFSGNDLSVILKDPSGADQALSVDYDDGVITVWLATDGSSVILSTADEVIAAINADVTVSELVFAETGDGTSTAVCAAVSDAPLIGGSDDATVLGVAPGTGSDGTGLVPETGTTLLVGGTAQNVTATYVTAEAVEVTNGDAICGVFDQARLREGALVTKLDTAMEAELVAAGFQLV